MRKKLLRWVAALIYAVTALAVPTWAAVIEPDPDLQRVMGDLYTLSVAMNIYYGDTQKVLCPALDDLAHYIRKPLPPDWPLNYRTAAFQDTWWVGRKVPEFSTARKFLREQAPLLGLWEQEGKSAWLGGAFVWMKALSFSSNNKTQIAKPEEVVFNVAQGDEKDKQRLFFNAPGTDYYWWSDIIYTPDTQAKVLRRFGGGAKGSFAIPPAPTRPRETLSASPVSTPPDFNLGDESEIKDITMGGVILNPIPRQNN
jgi:hypothetical protein